MNYMNMVKFEKVNLEESLATIYFQEREELFKRELDCSNIVPYFAIIEAVFQAAGRVAREYSNNTYGGIIVSFNDFCFNRPIFADEQLTLKAKILSYNDNSKVYYLQVSLYADTDIILPNGVVLIKQVEQITSSYLNSSIKIPIDKNLNVIGYVRL